MVKIKNCARCGGTLDRGLKRVSSGVYHPKCLKEKQKEHREYLLREVLGIKKRSYIKSSENGLPEIKSIKKRIKISALGLYITKIERNVLWGKLVRAGVCPEQASLRVENLCERMELLKKELSQRVESEKELNERFKEEFARLCLEEVNK